MNTSSHIHSSPAPDGQEHSDAPSSHSPTLIPDAPPPRAERYAGGARVLWQDDGGHWYRGTVADGGDADAAITVETQCRAGQDLRTVPRARVVDGWPKPVVMVEAELVQFEPMEDADLDELEERRRRVGRAARRVADSLGLARTMERMQAGAAPIALAHQTVEATLRAYHLERDGYAHAHDAKLRGEPAPIALSEAVPGVLIEAIPVRPEDSDDGRTCRGCGREMIHEIDCRTVARVAVHCAALQLVAADQGLTERTREELVARLAELCCPVNVVRVEPPGVDSDPAACELARRALGSDGPR